MCLAIPGRIESIEGAEPVDRQGIVDFSGIKKLVHLGFIEDAAVGDYVIVHVGVAISRLDSHEAELVFEYLRQIGELDQLESE